MKKTPLSPSFLENLFTRQERLALIFLVTLSSFGGILLGLGQQPSKNPTQIWQPVSINQAGIGELTTLPGIGPVTAGRIVQVRQQAGPFLTLRDLKRVQGISSKTRSRLKELVRFN